MTNIKWETPEPATRGKSAPRWEAIVESLKARPGEWALVAENEWSSNAAALSTRGCEVAMRGCDAKGRAAKIYARYVPEATNG